MPTPADPVRSLTAASPAPSIWCMTAAEEDAFYPSSDGRPMAENTWQGDAIFATVGDVRLVHPNALVAADLFVYPQRGNTDWKRAPDVLVALGAGTHPRMSYRVWREGKPPDWVLEVASPGTKHKDWGEKRDDYAAMGVPEYWLFDPMGGQFPGGMPRLQGLELVRGAYRPIASRLERGVAVIRSEVLGLDVRREGRLLRFRDSATGEDIRHHDEEVARADREAARADREARERKAAQARVAELEAALRRLQAGSSGETWSYIWRRSHSFIDSSKNIYGLDDMYTDSIL